MKKLFSIFPAFALAASLTACSAGDSPENSSVSRTDLSEYSSTSTYLESSDTLESSPISDAEPGISLTAPDGSILSGDEAEYVSEDFVKYNFSYIRYAQPIFYNIFDDSDLINWETLEFKINPETPIDPPKYIKVKAGDKLENGLTVKSVWCMFYRRGDLQQSTIEFDGEITLEGILSCRGDEGYNVSVGDLSFFVDTRKFGTLPISAADNSAEWQLNTIGFVNNELKFALIHDYSAVRLGNLDSVPIDLSGIISPNEYVRAKITIKDLSKGWSDGSGHVSYAELVSVEKL